MRPLFTLLFLCFAPLAQATSIVVDVGAPGVFFTRVYAIPGFAGTPLQGQTVSLDLFFSDRVTILCGRDSKFFDVGISFFTNGFAGFATGTGYIMDSNGNRMRPVSDVGSGSGAGEMGIGLLPLGTTGTPPIIFNGVHFDLTFPDSSYSITSASGFFVAQQVEYANGFRIGPHVPEAGGTLSLLSLALAALGITKRFPKRPLKS